LRLNPTIWRGKWVIDLRAAGYGNRYVLGDAAADREDALHAAYAKLAELRREGMADLAQQSIFAAQAPRLLAAVLDIWRNDHRTRSGDAGAARYVDGYVKQVRAELGTYTLIDFAPPDGHARVSAYAAELERRGFSGRTIRNRISVLRQALRMAVERGWLTSVPLAPRLPPKAAPVFRWIDETMFRALRAAMFEGAQPVGPLVQRLGGPQNLPRYYALRRVYASWLFYTGVHTYDADHATADWLFLDGGSYIRHNHKSARCIRPEHFPMPEPLLDDLRELQSLCPDALYPGRPFTGGPWPNVSRVLQRAAARIGLPEVNPQVLRRSFARQMCLLGYTERETADRMGHASTRLVHEVYVQCPPQAGAAKSRWVSGRDRGQSPSSGMARVLQMRGASEGDR